MDKKTVLLVDENDLDIELQKSFLRAARLNLLSARDGNDALSLIRVAPPDLVFMGTELGSIDAVECCRRIKSDPALNRVPVVILSSRVRPEDAARFRTAGCDEILLKPINRHLFYETTRAFLGVHLWSEPRPQLRVPVEFTSYAGQRLQGQTFDLSSGGLFLETGESLPVGATVFLSFPVPGLAGLFHCQGVVSWCNSARQSRKPEYPVGLGIEFVALIDADRQILDQFVQTLRRPQ